MSPLVGLWNVLLPCKWFEGWLPTCFFNEGFCDDAALLRRRRGPAQVAGCSRSLFSLVRDGSTLRSDTGVFLIRPALGRPSGGSRNA